MLGAQLWTVREYTRTIQDFSETLKKVADIGYEGIQISGYVQLDSEKVASLVEDYGLKIASTHEGWNRLMDNLDDVICEYKRYGCVHAAIGGLGVGSEYYSLEGLKRFIKELKPVAKNLSDEGIDFSYHNHNHELVRYGNKTWLDMLYEKTSPEMLKAEIDVFWIQAGGGDPAFWIRKCVGRAPLLHLKDLTVSRDFEGRNAEVGEGNLNWSAILQAAKEAGVEWYLVEQDLCYERNPFESLSISYKNLKEMGL
jgi:sugar phosphate isomerase/epimerase